MADARYYNGDDDRDELTADPEERCPVCKAHVDDYCEPWCDCQHCLNAAERQAQRRSEGQTASERAAHEREQMAEIQRTLK